MFKWEKKGLIFNPMDIKNRPEWMYEFSQAPNVVIFDEFIRVYFCCRPKPDENRQYVSYCTYLDLDRTNLFEVINISKQPILQLGDFGDFDEFGTYPVSVIKNNEDIWAYYGGWTRCESVPFNVSIGLAKSIDGGKTFQKIGKGPILSHSLDEPFVVTSPKIRKYNNTWYLSYTSGRKWIIKDGRPEIIYKIRMAYSQDGVNWTKVNKNIIDDKLGEEEAQACPDIIFYNGRYHMFFCYREPIDFRRNKNNSYRIGYAFSEDMINWTRDDSKFFIDVSEYGWDSEMVAYPNVFELDNKIYMFYLGNEVGRYGFGLAQLEGELG